MSQPAALLSVELGSLRRAQPPLAVVRALALASSLPLAPPSPPPLALQHLHDQGLYESQDEAELREVVLGRLDALVKEWIRGVAAVRGHPAEDANAKVGQPHGLESSARA